MKRALTVAGSDPGGGAGIQADIKTFSAFGVFGTSAITALTVQNSLGVKAVYPTHPAVVAAQMEAVLDDLGSEAVKTGMLCSSEIVRAVAAVCNNKAVSRLVVDPVMVSKNGTALLDEEGREALKTTLLPLCYLFTPNLPEAEVLLARSLPNLEAVEQAAIDLARLGPRYVLLKGGHLPGQPTDVLFDGQECHRLEGERLETAHTHGTGCTLSAALAACLALGQDVLEAARTAKRFVTEAIRTAPGFGTGHGPLNHFQPIQRMKR